MDFKVCFTCQKSKDIAEFHLLPQKNGKMIYAWSCRECVEKHDNKAKKINNDKRRLCMSCDKVHPIESFSFTNKGRGLRKKDCKSCIQMKAKIRKSQSQTSKEVISSNNSEHESENELQYHKRLIFLSEELEREKAKNRELVVQIMQLQDKLFVMEANIKEYGFDDLLSIETGSFVNSK